MRNVRTERDGITRSDQDRAGMAFHFLHGEVAPDGLVAPDRDRRPWVTGPRSTGGKAEYGVDVRGTFAAEVGRNFAALPTLLSNSECLAAATQVVIVGEAHDAGTQALLQAAWQAPMAHRVIQQVSPGQNLPDGHPATAKVQINDRATAYVCRGPECSLPLYDAADLAAELAA